MMTRNPLTVTVVAPEVPGFAPLRWLSELGGIARIPHVDYQLCGGPSCGRDAVSDAFRPGRDVIIWSGHGLPGGLAIPDECGGAAFLSPRWLAAQAKIAAPWVFVLAACNSMTQDEHMQSLAQAISMTGVNVIGYNVKVDDLAAVRFNIELVRMLARGADLGSAFEVAKEAIADAYPETAQGVYILPGLTNGLGEIRARLDRLETNVAEILALLQRNENDKSDNLPAKTSPARPRRRVSDAAAGAQSG